MMKIIVIISGNFKKIGANRANNIPPPFTKPACMIAEAGVGELSELINHEWKGYIADWVNAVIKIKTEQIIRI